jgi:V-type H+-transporting ATPase subunit F
MLYNHRLTYARWRTQVANRIRHQIDAHKAAFPSVIEIPSKDHPYDPAKDSLMARVESLMGAGGR